MFSVKFSNAWSFPLAHSPFVHKAVKIEKCIPLLEVLTYGMSDLSAGEYDPTGGGWSQPGGPTDSYGIAFTEISDILNKVKESVIEVKNARYRKRILVNENKNQVQGAIDMATAIAFYDIKKCMYLAQYRGISIDLEINDPGSNQDGETALLKASEENAGAINHKLIINDDGSPVLQVAYLLDRDVYRPNVNQENKLGQTPLMRACSKGRPYVLQALLDRGADVNYINRFNQSALHFAVEVGNTECIRILLERGVDVHLVDSNNKTAFDIANDNGFTLAMSQMSRFAGGNMGKLAPSRGNVNDSTTCPNGCGEFLYSYDTFDHMQKCPLREVTCENSCGTRRILFKDYEEHLSVECTHRLTTCELCSEQLPLNIIPSHIEKECKNRLIKCSFNCGLKVRSAEMRVHLANCFNRPKACPQCGATITRGTEIYHSKNDCPLRRVECPLFCSATVVANVLTNHLQDICPRRPVECQFCKITLKFSMKKAHEKKCDLRTEQCTCGEFVQIDLIKEHRITSCSHRFVDCDLKCGLKVRYADRENHFNNFCGNRLVPCPLGCINNASLDSETLQVRFRTLDAHLSNTCPNRPVKCGLCSENVSLNEIEIHRTVKCDKRMVACRIPKCSKTIQFCDREQHERFACKYRSILIYIITLNYFITPISCVYFFFSP